MVGKSSRLCKRVRAIWDEEKSSRRKDLLDGVARLFKKSEFVDISIQSICQETGLAKGTFYLYFSSKEEIFLALTEVRFREWADCALMTLKGIKITNEKANTSQVASLFAKSFRTYDDLLRLLSMLHAIIERNVAPEKIVPFKQTLNNIQIQQAAVWFELFPTLMEDDFRGLMTFISSAVVGIWTVAYPPKAAQRAVELAGIETMTRSFEEILTRQLSIFLWGIVHRPSGITG